MDFLTFQETLGKELNQLGKGILIDDLEAKEKIFISGDGASWIKKGLEIIPESLFVLDRLHLEKYLQEGLRRYSSTLSAVRSAIEGGDKEKVKVLLKNAQKATPEEKEVKKLQVLKRYFLKI